MNTRPIQWRGIRHERLFHVAMGLAHNFPLCCCIAFAFGLAMAKRDGLLEDDGDAERCWVPCAFHQRYTPRRTRRLVMY